MFMFYDSITGIARLKGSHSKDQRRDVLPQGDSMAALQLWWDTIRGVVTTAPREHFDLLRGDVRYALRNLRRHPGSTAVAALALAVGIGANTAVFTIVNSVLIRTLPYADPAALVTMFETHVGRPFQGRNRLASVVILESARRAALA